MKIYIVERDYPQCRPEPEVFESSNYAKLVVNKEYEDTLVELGITLKDIENCNGHWVVYRNDWSESRCEIAIIDSWSFERYAWRITEHNVTVPEYQGFWVQDENKKFKCSNCNGDPLRDDRGEIDLSWCCPQCGSRNGGW
jgi:hypothetical protein